MHYGEYKHNRSYDNNYNSRYSNNYRDNRTTQHTNYQKPSNRACSVSLKEPYYSQILSKVKTVEGRINSGQFKNLKIGDQITFFNNHTRAFQKEAHCKIIDKHVYSSFEEMLKAEGLNNCLPGTKSLAEGVRIYDDLPGFRQRAKESGVVGIKIQLIEKEKVQNASVVQDDERIGKKRQRDEFEMNTHKQPVLKKQRHEPEQERHHVISFPKVSSPALNPKLAPLDDLESININKTKP